ncbi:dipeptidyl peptidase 1-like isoform X2 [Glandiceps talaboti]
MALVSVYVCACLVLLPIVLADTPGNCTYDDVAGYWQFSLGESGYDNSLNCTGFAGPIVKSVSFELLFPDVVFDNYGNQGFWTMVYNQGFEVVINGKKYFAFSKYKVDGKVTTSVCSETMPGWVHNADGKDWACFTGKKTDTVSTPKINPTKDSVSMDRLYKANNEYINSINSIQKSWTATVYDDYKTMSLKEMKQRAGGHHTGIVPPKPAPVSAEIKAMAASLPLAFDWRNVDGQNFVTPVRDQASCGSCFAFSSAGMYEARLKVMTNNSVDDVIISPQDVVQCSEYSQGCDGGFPYLIAGKYADDFGFVDESCLPYTGRDGSCPAKEKSCKRYYATNYHYVGGFYGACNEELMKVALVKNGPLSVSFMVYSDFLSYKSGIYQHTGLEDRFNPFEITNHAVLAVGYGYDGRTKENYWIVKNSWGTGWGEDGYFRIRRGSDECAIESIAVETFPIP